MRNLDSASADQLLGGEGVEEIRIVELDRDELVVLFRAHPHLLRHIEPSELKGSDLELYFDSGECTSFPGMRKRVGQKGGLVGDARTCYSLRCSRFRLMPHMLLSPSGHSQGYSDHCATPSGYWGLVLWVARAATLLSIRLSGNPDEG
mgnify:CR=1 FL=1